MAIFTKYKHTTVLLILFGFLSFIIFYRYMTLLPKDMDVPEEALVIPVQQIILPDYRVDVLEKYSQCEKYQLNCRYETTLEGAARTELNNQNAADLSEKYPASAGWQIDWQNKRVVLEHLQPGLCPVHKKTWHLGEDDKGERVAIYLGPAVASQDAMMIKETDLELKALPIAVREKITQRAIEFNDWDDLIATLDSFAENHE